MTDIEAQRAREAARRREQERQRQAQQAAQNAFRGIIRIVTPAVNLINRVVQGVTGGRGGIAQIARGLTGLVNRVYQQATGRAWGAQGGTGGDTIGAAANQDTGEEDTPPLPPQDVAESNDRLRELNEEEDETRPFNWNEFFGDDFTLEDIGDSVRESAEWFVRFVRGEADEEVPLLTQIRTLFEEARGRLEGEVEPSPVDENWSNLTMEMLQERFGDDWTTVYDDIAEHPSEELITLIKNEASQQFGISFSESLVGLSAEEVVALYRAELERRHEEIVNSGIGILARDRDSHEEIRRAHEFWTQVQDTFGVQQDVTMDVSEFAIHELGLPQTTTPGEADARIDALIEGYIASGVIDPESVQDMIREEIAYAYYEASQNRITSGEQWLNAAWNEHERLLAQVSNDPSVTNEHFSALRALEQNIRTVTANIESLRPQTSESRNLVLAFNRMYTPPQTPYGELLLTVLSFTTLDTYVSGFDFVRSVAAGDYLGAAISALDIATPGRLRPAVDALRGQGDELAQAVGRQIDGFGQLFSDGGWQPAYAGNVSPPKGNVSQFANNNANSGRTPRNPSNSSVFVVRIDPTVPGRPDPAYPIDTTIFDATARYAETLPSGAVRDYRQFWQEWIQLETQVGRNSLSSNNLWLIEHGYAPVVDAQWITVFPEHAPFKNEGLDHHHIGGGAYAVPLPATAIRSFGIDNCL